MYKESVSHLEIALKVSPGSPDKIGALGHVYAAFQRRELAEQALEELHRLAERRYVSAFDFAIIYAGLGDADKALECLDRASEERSFSMLLSLKAEPRLDCLRSDPRFQALARHVGLAP